MSLILSQMPINEEMKKDILIAQQFQTAMLSILFFPLDPATVQDMFRPVTAVWNKQPVS